MKTYILHCYAEDKTGNIIDALSETTKFSAENDAEAEIIASVIYLDEFEHLPYYGFYLKD